MGSNLSWTAGHPAGVGESLGGETPPCLELGAESKKHLQLSSLPTPSYAALRGRGPHHLVANQSRSTSAHPRVELHAGLLEAGLAFLPEGCHGLIAHPLGCLQLVFRIPGVIQGVLGDNKRWLSHRNHRLPLPEVGMGGPAHLCQTWAHGVLVSIPALVHVCHLDVPSHLVLNILPSSSCSLVLSGH